MKNFISVFFLISIFIPHRSDAKTLLDYQKERDAAKAQADRVQAERLRKAREKAKQKEREKNQKLEEKRALVARGKSELLASSMQKTQSYQKELNWVQDQKRKLEAVNEVYVAGRRSWGEAYSAGIRRWVTYKEAEPVRKSNLKQWLSQIQNATSSEQLFEPREHLVGLQRSEAAEQLEIANEFKKLAADLKNLHARYRKNRAPFESFLKKYKQKHFNFPKDLVKKMETAILYTHLRADFFRQNCQIGIRAFESKAKQSIDTAVHKQTIKHEKNELNSELSTAFLETVNQLIDKELRLGEASLATVPGHQKLYSQFVFFNEALKYKSRCSDLKQLARTGSPDYDGCFALAPTLVDAQAFMDEIALAKMRLTLFDAQLNAPKELRNQVNQLDKSIKTRASLKQALQIHDDLLSTWEKLI